MGKAAGGLGNKIDRLPRRGGDVGSRKGKGSAARDGTHDNVRHCGARPPARQPQSVRPARPGENGRGLTAAGRATHTPAHGPPRGSRFLL